EQAAAARPQDEDAALTLARASRDAGDRKEAEHALDRLLQARPPSIRGRWMRLNLIDPVPPDDATAEAIRDRWMHDIQEFDATLRLDTPAQIAEAFAAIQEANNFYLHYQRDDNRAAQELYGRVLGRIAAARVPMFAAPPEPPPSRDRPRIGFISAF